MSISYGFYDSENHDRVYNSEEFGSLFDGLIHDGVYETYKDAMMVRAATGGMSVYVSPGRAWFDHTWTYVDSPYLLTLNQSEIFLDRIDAVVLRIDKRLNFRENTINIIKGDPSSAAEKPVVERNPEDYVYQYPLAYVSVKAGVAEITNADIENAIGTSECPFVTGIIDHLTIDEIIKQWDAQLDVWLGYERDKVVEWFDNIQYVLDDDTAVRLQNQIDKLAGRMFIDAEGYICIDYRNIHEKEGE